MLPAPAEDVVEIDEICVRHSPPLWLWIHASMNEIAISRVLGQVLGFALGDRSQESLAWLWTDIPKDYQDKPIRTDGWQVYKSFFATLPDFPVGQHQACEKGSLQFAANVQRRDQSN